MQFLPKTATKFGDPGGKAYPSTPPPGGGISRTQDFRVARPLLYHLRCKSEGEFLSENTKEIRVIDHHNYNSCQ